MKLFDWWASLPDRVGGGLPTLIKIVFLLWMFLGILIALVLELQPMPDTLRFVLGAPAAIGILWMGMGVLLKPIDWLVALVARVGRTRKANNG